MKIISWNCQGAFRKKADTILTYRPDLLVIQECEHPDHLVFKSTTRKPQDLLWFGDNKHKGLGIFSYGQYRFKLCEPYNKELKNIAPIAITGGPLDFVLFAIWAHNPHDPDGQYIEQVWKAIDCYDHLLNRGPVILTGDFNSNAIWDRKSRIENHSAVVEKLLGKNIVSVYHTHLGQVQGQEKHPTFYLYRNKHKPYHLDYFFSSLDLYDKVKTVKIGSHKKWSLQSDHTPLIVDLDI